MREIVKEAVVGGREVKLAYTAWAMIDINRALRNEDGSSEELPKVILEDNQENYELFCRVIGILIYSAAQYLGYRGLKANEVMESKTVAFTLFPNEIVKLKQVAMDAILAGLGREEDSTVDLGLAELEKKNRHRQRKR